MSAEGLSHLTQSLCRFREIIAVAGRGLASALRALSVAFGDTSPKGRGMWEGSPSGGAPAKRVRGWSDGG